MSPHIPRKKRRLEIPGRSIPGHPGAKTVIVREPGGGLSLRQQPPPIPKFLANKIVCDGLGGGDDNYEEGRELLYPL